MYCAGMWREDCRAERKDSSAGLSDVRDACYRLDRAVGPGRLRIKGVRPLYFPFIPHEDIPGGGGFAGNGIGSWNGGFRGTLDPGLALQFSMARFGVEAVQGSPTNFEQEATSRRPSTSMFGNEAMSSLQSWWRSSATAFRSFELKDIPRSILDNLQALPVGREIEFLGVGMVTSVSTLANLGRKLAAQEAAGVFTVTGELSRTTVKGAREIIGAESLGNPAIPAGFSKFATESFASPSGRFRVHFYMNPATEEIFYGLDYKALFNSSVGVIPYAVGGQ